MSSTASVRPLPAGTGGGRKATARGRLPASASNPSSNSKAKHTSPGPSSASTTSLALSGLAKATPNANSKAKTGKPKPKASVRALHPVDTNLAAHDRTDPFAALTTLRQLLSALPARPGSAQYKFGPDEHRLAVHLLGIVEPFVQDTAPCTCGCTCKARRTLVRLPTEILDAVAFWVDGARDLRALARSRGRVGACGRLVRAKASAVRVWHHLVVHRALARNVRRLEVLDERAPAGREVVPAGIRLTETDLESTEDELGMHAKQERWLVRALERMTALTSVKWECGHSLVAFESVWPVLAKCGSIEEVEVHDNLVFQPTPQEDASESEESTSAKPGQLVLRDLKKASFHGSKSTFGASKEPDLTQISAMLNGCPNLETLAISYVPRRAPGFFNPVADDLLLCGRWTRLRSLTLTSLWCTPDAGLDAAAAFLLAHVDLEVLHLDVAFGAGGQAGGGTLATFKFPNGCLPRLRELKASRDLASALLACPTGTEEARPLETLKGVRLSGSLRDRLFSEYLGKYGAQTVRRLELAGWNDMEDVKRLAECVPRLNWLDLGKKEGVASGAAGPASKAAQPANVSSHFTEWANVLANFSELTTFHGVRFFYEVATSDGAVLSLSDRSRVRKNDEVAAVLAWKCPKLRRVDHWEDGAGKVLVLVRDAEKVRYEVRRIKV
ncbi:hypothetical protein TRAPUB_793 [Trametes pubescens]|uniref:F-box domain-containing protein n=1 Tax=Trametes pubescens TaxID=154538 RepID=A0A1M2VKW6_TRAPU|nr:hypothetical protein TRAPUB_793 [Trametes pubescens]